MTRPKMRQWTDAESLDVLNRGGAGQTFAAVAEVYGTSRNAIAGLIHRIWRDTDNAERRQGYGPPATRRGCRDGDLPAQWWVEGLKARKRRQVAG